MCHYAISGYTPLTRKVRTKQYNIKYKKCLIFFSHIDKYIKRYGYVNKCYEVNK